MKKLLLMTAMVMALITVNAQRSSLKVTDLPKTVTDYVTKDFAGYTISNAVKVVTDNVTNYEVTVIKGTTKDILSFDNNGKFLKKLAVHGGMTEKVHSSAVTPQKNHVKK
jgi:archaellum component FlaG (FlaF/FlaG flagellin family)